jgi:hypothetical protein
VADDEERQWPGGATAQSGGSVATTALAVETMVGVSRVSLRSIQSVIAAKMEARQTGSRVSEVTPDGY